MIEKTKRSGAVRTALCVLAATLVLWAMSAIASVGRAERAPNDAYTTGRVTAILGREELFYGPDDSLRDLTLTFTADLGSETVTATQTISDGVIAGDRREVEPGDRVTLMNNAVGEEANYVFTGYVRTDKTSISFNGAWAQNLDIKEMFVDFLGDKKGARLDYGSLYHLYDGATLTAEHPEYEIPNAYLCEDVAFLESVKTGVKNRSNIENVLESARLMDALYESAATGREICLEVEGK